MKTFYQLHRDIISKFLLNLFGIHSKDLSLHQLIICLRLPLPIFLYILLRHHVKPGITGWAQICYSYGASVEDAKQKLQFDLYYLKNYSVFLDMVILLQTVTVILWAKGAR